MALNHNPLASRRVQRWLIGVGLLLILCALRLPWLEADGGNWSFWSYAVFGMDEMLYTSGGRLAALTGKFMDPEMNEPMTFVGSWGMHFLSYLGYRFAGLSLAACRWPTVLLAIAGWTAAYVALTRRTAPLVAGLVIAILSCNPYSLTFERIASNDVTVGALTIIAFAFTTGRRWFWAAIGGMMMALAVSVKATALPLCPLLVLAMATKRQDRHWRLVAASISFAVTLGALWWGRELCIRAALGPGDVTAQLREVTRAYMTLQQQEYHVSAWLKPLSIFPRWPIAHHYGPLMIGFWVLPVWWLASRLVRRRRWLTRTTPVALGILIYLFPFATQRIHVARYLIPAVYFLPELLVIARCAWRRAVPVTWRMWAVLGAAAAVLLALYWVRFDLPSMANLARDHMYNEVVLPAVAAWSAIGIRLATGALVAAVAMAVILPARGLRQWLSAIVGGCACAWLFFNGYTISLLTSAQEFWTSQLLLQLGLFVGLAVTLGAFGSAWSRWYLVLALTFAGFAALNPYWRTAYRDAWVRTDYIRAAASELETTLPPNSIVIGRRAPLFLCATRLRVGMAHFGYSADEFLGKVNQLLERYPTQPLYWLVDSDGCPPWDFYRVAAQKPWRATPVLRVFVLSGDTLRLQATTEDRLPLIPVYLMRITKNTAAGAN